MSEDPAAIRVAVADGLPLFRRGIVAALTEAQIAVVAETERLDAVPAMMADVHPDVLLLGVTGAEPDAAQICAGVQASHPATGIVVVVETAAALSGLVRAGASGYLQRDASAEELVRATREVAAGRTLLTPRVAALLLDDYASLVRRTSVDSSRLSARELEVLQLIARGMGNRAIAEALFLSENTVKNHVRNIHEKLQVHSRTQAVARAVRDGLLTLS